MTDSELLALAATLTLPGAPTDRAEQQIISDLETLRITVDRRHRLESYLTSFQARAARAAEQAASAALLRSPTLEPVDPTDLVLINITAQGYRPSRSPVVCVPFGTELELPSLHHLTERGCLVCSAEHFDDLPRVITDSYHRQSVPASRGANSIAVLIAAMIETTDQARFGQLVRWYRFSHGQTGDLHDLVCQGVRRSLSVLGRLDLIESTAIAPSWSLAPPHVHEVPYPLADQ